MTEPSPIGSASDDPRICEEHVESFRAGANDIVLVGVVHDHPASKFRVRHVVEAQSPDVLALELPPLSIPLYQQYAADSRTPPAFGGEMSAAIQAAETDRIEGIDGPSPSFVFQIGARLFRDRASPRTACRTMKTVAAIGKKTVKHRFGAVVGRFTSHRTEINSPTEHETSVQDSRERQASDEAAQIQTANAMMSAFETSLIDDICTEARERHMATRLRSLGETGDVVAVVGMGHLDELRSLLGDDD